MNLRNGKTKHATWKGLLFKKGTAEGAAAKLFSVKLEKLVENFISFTEMERK